MCDISIPISFEELLSGDNEGFIVEEAWEITDYSDSEIQEKIEDLVYADLQNGVGDCGIDQRKIDTLYSTINGINMLSADSKTLLAETICELAKRALDMVSDNMDPSTKNAVKIIFYFLQIFFIKIEASEKSAEASKAVDLETMNSKGRGKGKSAKKSGDDDSDDFSAAHWRPILLEYVRDISISDASLIWTMGIVQESFLTNSWNIPLQLLEDYRSEVAGCAKSRKVCLDILVACSNTLTGSSCVASISPLLAALMNSVCEKEHMGSVVAELCHRTKVKYDFTISKTALIID